MTIDFVNSCKTQDFTVTFPLEPFLSMNSPLILLLRIVCKNTFITNTVTSNSELTTHQSNRKYEKHVTFVPL